MFMNNEPINEKKVNVAVIGTGGHASAELLVLLARNRNVEITALATGNQEAVGKSIGEVRTDLADLLDLLDLRCEKLRPEEIAERCDVAIATTPIDQSLKYIPGILAAGKRCIDLSAAYRLRDAAIFEQYYGLEHSDPQNLQHAVYGLPELFQKRIRGATLIANPGCYPTASLLGIAPVLQEELIDTQKPIIIRAISGYSGAGVHYQPTSGTRPYKIGRHQHTPEIAQACEDYTLQCHGQTSNVLVSFSPRINDNMERGIDADISMFLSKSVDVERLREIFNAFYTSEPFVDVLSKEPDVKDVVKTNRAQLAVWQEANLLHVISIIDNLRKGAASQAIQNLNLMCDFEETTGLL